MIYTAKQIQNHETDCPNAQGDWVPARPINYLFDSWKDRLCCAWGVFTGKYDTLNWEDDK